MALYEHGYHAFRESDQEGRSPDLENRNSSTVESLNALPSDLTDAQHDSSGPKTQATYWEETLPLRIQYRPRSQPPNSITSQNTSYPGCIPISAGRDSNTTWIWHRETPKRTNDIWRLEEPKSDNAGFVSRAKTSPPTISGPQEQSPIASSNIPHQTRKLGAVPIRAKDSHTTIVWDRNSPDNEEDISPTSKTETSPTVSSVCRMISSPKSDSRRMSVHQSDIPAATAYYSPPASPPVTPPTSPSKRNNITEANENSPLLSPNATLDRKLKENTKSHFDNSLSNFKNVVRRDNSAIDTSPKSPSKAPPFENPDSKIAVMWMELEATCQQKAALDNNIARLSTALGKRSADGSVDSDAAQTHLKEQLQMALSERSELLGRGERTGYLDREIEGLRRALGQDWVTMGDQEAEMSPSKRRRIEGKRQEDSNRQVE